MPEGSFERERQEVGELFLKIENPKGNEVLSFDEHMMIPYERDELLKLYWEFHPRFRFLKSCPDGNFLDIGSGSGGLIFWKEWEHPLRSQLKMYAVDLADGEFTNRYEAFKKINLDEADISYEDALFDCVYCAHVVEHLKYPSKLIRNIAKIIKGGGMVYIEQPNHNSVNVPGRFDFQKAGVQCAQITTNFFDDQTHRQPYSADEIIELFHQYADGMFTIVEKGTVWNEYLKNMMLAYAYREQDTEIWTYAVWLHYLWSDYVVLRKKEHCV